MYYEDLRTALVGPALDNPEIFGYVDHRPAWRNPQAAFSHLVKTSVVTYLIILGGGVVWCVGLIAAPVLVSQGGGWGILGSSLYQFFHPICHQLEGRSFHMLGKPLAVCIRCSSVYVAFLAGTLLFPLVVDFTRTLWSRRDVLLYAVLPMVVDVALDEFGIHSSTGITRLITGALFGIVVPFYIIPTAQEAVQELVSAARFFSPSDVKKGSLHA